MEASDELKTLTGRLPVWLRYALAIGGSVITLAVATLKLVPPGYQENFFHWLRDLLSTPPIVEIAKLCNYRPPPVLTDGPARFSELPKYMTDANKDLIQHLESVAGRHRPRLSGVTFLMSPAGVGKSTLLQTLKTTFQDRFCSVSTHAYLTAAGPVTLVPDLQIGDAVINTLPGIVSQAPHLRNLISAERHCSHNRKFAEIIALDDLDEIAPATAAALFDSLVAAVRNPSQSIDSVPHHFIVAGRPEVFASILHDPHEKLQDVRKATFEVHGPDFQTTGDLAFLARYYDSRIGNSVKGGVLDSTDFARFLQERPFLREGMRNWTIANFTLEQYRLGENRSYELQQHLFDNILERNQRSHGRPQGTMTDYVHWLEQAAANYATATDTAGYFVVNFTDTVGASHHNTKTATSVRRLLDRSGVVDIKPVNSTTLLYRFEPRWLHAYLVGRRNQEFHPRHAKRTQTSCDLPN